MTKEIGYRFDFDMEEVDWCCGARTAGNFTLLEQDANSDYNKKYKNGVFTVENGWRSTKAQAAESAVKLMIEDSNGRPIVMWFKRRVNYLGQMTERFEHEELRQAVKHTKGAISLGVTINPGTNNHLDGYVLTAHATKGEALE